MDATASEQNDRKKENENSERISSLSPPPPYHPVVPFISDARTNSRFFNIVVCVAILLDDMHIGCCCRLPSAYRSIPIWIKWLIEALKVFARALTSALFFHTYFMYRNRLHIFHSVWGIEWENPFSNAPMKFASRRRGPLLHRRWKKKKKNKCRNHVKFNERQRNSNRQNGPIHVHRFC